MKKVSKILCIAIAVIMLLTVFAGCGVTQSKVEPTAASTPAGEQLPRPDGYDVVKELKAYTEVMPLTGYYYNGTKVSPDNKFRQYVMENFKIDLQNTYVSGEDYDAKCRMLAASDELPDVLQGWNPNESAVFDELTKAGKLLELDDLITNYITNARLWYDKQIRDMFRYTDGKLYLLNSGGMPIDDGSQEVKDTLNKFKAYNGTCGFLINVDIMNALNITYPKNTEELYQFLKAAVQLPEVNGKKPIGMVQLVSNTPNTSYPGFDALRTLAVKMFEETPNGILDPWVADDANQRMKFIYDYQGYVKFLKYFAKLFRDGLLDKDIFVMTQEQAQEKLKEGRVAYGTSNYATSTYNMAVRNEAYGKGPYEDYPGYLRDVQKYYAWDSSTVGFWLFAFSKKVKDPVRLAKYIEWHLSDEGLLFDNYGPPDPTKTWNVWWYEEGEPLNGFKLPGKQVVDNELLVKWDTEQAGWEGEKLGSWGVNACGIRSTMNYSFPTEFGKLMIPEYSAAIVEKQFNEDTMWNWKDIKIQKFRASQPGEVFKTKGTQVNDLLQKWEAKIIMSARDDAEVETMFNQMMTEAKAAGYDEIALEAYQTYVNANK